MQNNSSFLGKYLPNTIIPTEISYDYGILSYCQHLLQILQYMVEYNQTEQNIQLNDNIRLVEENIAMLLSQVDNNLVKRCVNILKNNIVK